MLPALVVPWTGAGIAVGVALAAYSQHLLISTPRYLPAYGVAATLLTACTFAGLAWRFGPQFALLPYTVMAAVGIFLSLIDVIERRLPSALTYSGLTVIFLLLVVAAIIYSRGPELLRAVAAMAGMAGFYLILAVASRGGLGAGDVKLGALVGITLGWESWSALITATFLGWLVAALAWLILWVARRKPRDWLMPMGPFMVLGGLLTICILPH